MNLKRTSNKWIAIKENFYGIPVGTVVEASPFSVTGLLRNWFILNIPGRLAIRDRELEKYFKQIKGDQDQTIHGCVP